jgi:hypothetical protein
MCNISKLKPILPQGFNPENLYTIRGLKKTLTLPEYSYVPTKCEKKLEYNLVNMDGSDAFPKFFKQNNKEILLAGDKTSYPESDKTFNFKLIV